MKNFGPEKKFSIANAGKTKAKHWTKRSQCPSCTPLLNAQLNPSAIINYSLSSLANSVKVGVFRPDSV